MTIFTSVDFFVFNNLNYKYRKENLVPVLKAAHILLAEENIYVKFLINMVNIFNIFHFYAISKTFSLSTLKLYIKGVI